MNLFGHLHPAQPFRCPHCARELPLADLNVSQDLALCRACGYTGPFLSSAPIPLLSDEELARPPRPIQLQRGFGDQLTITSRPKRTALLFLVPFTAFWSGISMTGIYILPLATGKFDWKMGLFGMPFLIGTIVLLALILNLLVGKTIITLAKGKVQVGHHFLGWKRVKEMEFGKGASVTLQPSSIKVNNVPQMEIVLSKGGQSLRFGALGLSEEGRRYVAAVLRRVASGG